MEQSAHQAMQAARPSAGRVAIDGRARKGIARFPRSLGSTLDPSLMTTGEVEREIFEIRRWLVDHQDASADRQLLLGVLRGLETRLAPLTAGSPVGPEEFSAAFRQEFGSVLHVFGESTGVAGPFPITIQVLGESDEPPAQSDPLVERFTPAQRDMLMDFIMTRRIPERLFNGDEVGDTTAQQRLLISAHILANGTYRPGSFEQRVHARMCWHWVQIVHHYAGATPATGPISQGVMGSFDLFGDLLLGSGEATTIFQERPVYAEDLPSTEGESGVGPIQPGTGHASASAIEQARRAADPTVRPTVHRRPALPFTRFGELQAGDWLWYYNANASPGGSHSVIFSHWTSDQQRSENGVQFQDAIVFSQGSPGAGGREHPVRLGAAFSPDESIYPITHVSRVSPDARPAVTPWDLLPPDPGGRRLAALDAENQRFIRTKERRLGHPLDQGLLRQWLREQNHDCIVSLGEQLTGRQQDLLEEANASYLIENLVRLNQRLRALVTNAGILERNMESAFDEELAERHTEAQASIDETRAQVGHEMEEIDLEIAPIRESIAEREGLLSEIDLAPEMRQLQRQVGALWQQIEPLPRSPERDELQRQRRALQARIRELGGHQQAQRRILSAIRSEIRDLRRQLQPLTRRRQRAETQQTAAERELPYGSLHPGQLSGQETGRTTGRLSDLDPQPPWSLLNIRTDEGPQ
jgi:chaperonin cofactor prefoldin